MFLSFFFSSFKFSFSEVFHFKSVSKFYYSYSIVSLSTTDKFLKEEILFDNTNNATCVSLKLHPLYGKECNYDPSLEYSLGICGPLRCFYRKCLSCVDGMVDYADNKVCFYQEWSYNFYLYDYLGDSSAILLSLLLVILIIWITFTITQKSLLLCLYLCK